MPETSQIDPFEVMLTCVARFYPYVVELWRVKVTDFCRTLFATVRTDHASKLPRAKTIRTHEITIAAFGARLFALKKTDLRFAATKRARPFAAGQLSSGWSGARFRHPKQIRLQDRLREKLRV